MNNSRGMTPDESAAIERIAGHLFDTTYGNGTRPDITARKAFIAGFRAGRIYTINQFEDFTEQFERDLDDE